MATKIDKDACRESYNLVRDDNSDVNWVIFKYEGHLIVPDSQGTEYEDFRLHCSDDCILFGYHRIITGDAMSKRAKFALITWIGDQVSVLKRAKVSTDKSLVKEVVQAQQGKDFIFMKGDILHSGQHGDCLHPEFVNFAKEFVICDYQELAEEYIKQELEKTGGANYDAQLQ